jgi:hypothetical protein
MAIGSALERGSLICAYDEHGITLFQKVRGISVYRRPAGIHQFHRHCQIRLDHLHLRRTRHHHLRQGSIMGSAN